MLDEFLTWWWRQLAAFAPAGLRDGDAALRDAVVASLEADLATLVVARRRRRRETAVGAFRTDDPTAPAAMRAAVGGGGGGVVLHVPDAVLLTREVTLPLAAERDLPRVLAYEMDRLTPFAAEDVVWTHAVTERDTGRGRVVVALTIVPRAALAAALALLRQAGLPASVLEVPRPDGVRVVRLGPPGVREAWRRRATIGAGALCAALAIAAIAVPLLRQSLALGAVDDRIAALRPAVDRAEAIRRRIATRAASVDVVAAQRQKSGDALAVLAAVTEILPDDTWLDDLALSHRKLSLRGQSAAAARLISALAADPAIRNPVFAAPVTRNEAKGTDIFAIDAEVNP